MKIKEVLLQARKQLNDNNIDEREARLLLSFVLGIKSDDLIKFEEIDDSKYKRFVDVLNKRCSHIPYAYIVGHQDFMKLQFKVNKNVLIPRADTEILVEEVIKLANSMDKEQLNILDMCTGSGCIAISLSKYIKNAKVCGTDISEEAIRVAKENALLNDANVDFYISDLFKNVTDKFDIIVSNPPYIKREIIDTLEKEVKDNEPILALDGGKDGLDFYEKIINDSPKFLNDDGYIAFEIGYDQGEDVSNLLKKNGFDNINVIKDYSGNDRVVIGRI